MLRFVAYFLLTGSFAAVFITLSGVLPLDAGLLVTVSYLLAGTLCLNGHRGEPPGMVLQTQPARPPHRAASIVALRERQVAQDLTDARSRLMKLALLIVAVGFAVVMLSRYLSA